MYLYEVKKIKIMIYDPNNPLTDEQLEQLGKEDFDSMLEYLDGVSAHITRKGNPKVKEHKEQKRQVLIEILVLVVMYVYKFVLLMQL